VSHTSDLDAAASLADPLRRDLYDFVVAASEPVSRDRAAEALGISRQVAAYHLDRLADDGLLDVEFRRLTGRQGPGAGRPSKLYRRSDRVVEVTIPPRRYELAARILLDAVRRQELDPDSVAQVAREAGKEIGRRGLEQALIASGYEPARENGEIRFRNCPFHVLADQDRRVTCGMNLALVEGIVEAAGSDLEPVLAPEEGYCCVRLRLGGDGQEESKPFI